MFNKNPIYLAWHGTKHWKGGHWMALARLALKCAGVIHRVYPQCYRLKKICSLVPFWFLFPISLWQLEERFINWYWVGIENWEEVGNSLDWGWIWILISHWDKSLHRSPLRQTNETTKLNCLKWEESWALEIF